MALALALLSRARSLFESGDYVAHMQVPLYLINEKAADYRQHVLWVEQKLTAMHQMRNCIPMLKARMEAMWPELGAIEDRLFTMHKDLEVGGAFASPPVATAVAGVAGSGDGFTAWIAHVRTNIATRTHSDHGIPGDPLTTEWMTSRQNLLDHISRHCLCMHRFQSALVPESENEVVEALARLLQFQQSSDAAPLPKRRDRNVKRRAADLE